MLIFLIVKKVVDVNILRLSNVNIFDVRDLPGLILGASNWIIPKIFWISSKAVFVIIFERKDQIN
jgi:hypothetical protein